MLNEEPDSFTTLCEKLTEKVSSSATSSGASSPQPGRRPVTLNPKSYWLPTPPPSASNSSLSLTASPPSPQAELSSRGHTLSEEPLLVTLKVFPATVSPSGSQLEFVPAGLKMRKPRSSSLVTPTLPTSPGPLIIHILTPLLGKPHIAATTSELARKALQSQVTIEDFKLTVQELGAKFEGALTWVHAGNDHYSLFILSDPSHPNGWACPDLLIIHTPAAANLPQKAPFMLQGLPPWQIHLTEMT